MKFRLKIVPNAKPNSDGRWITVEKDRGPPHFDELGKSRWLDTYAHFYADVPKGEHLVQVEKVQKVVRKKHG